MLTKTHSHHKSKVLDHDQAKTASNKATEQQTEVVEMLHLRLEEEDEFKFFIIHKNRYIKQIMFF